MTSQTVISETLTSLGMTKTMSSTLLDRLRAASRRRRALLSEDRGSLPMALLLIMIGMALAAALLPTMIVQDRATVFDGTRMDNLAAAQAGVDVVVGDIRAATTAANSGVGSPTALPCTSAPSSPITGTVNGVGNARYSAVVSYYVTDPIANPQATPMVCVAHYGVYDAATFSFVPSYALITATGTDGATAGGNTGGSLGRTITSTYVFQTTNRNVPGGQIRIYPPNSLSTTVSMCMDVGAAPAAGTVVIMQPCSTSTPPPNQQLFSYRSDLTIQLSTAVTPSYPNGLCLDVDVLAGAPLPNRAVYLSPCQALGNPPFEQQWSFNDNGEFQASLVTSAATGGLSNLCLTVPAAQTVGSQVSLDSCNVDGGGTSSPRQAWLPAPSVGDGAAAAPQLVNYQQFGRCLDVTGQNVSATQLIAYPCKQNPYRGAVAWNQQFTFNSTGQLATPTGYCLYSPRTEAGYVRVTQCANPGWVAGVTAAQLVWTQPGTTTATPYPQRYTFVDMDGTRCLGIAPPPSGDNSPWYYITVNTCNGSTAQKWNADPNLGSSTLQNTVER